VRAQKTDDDRAQKVGNRAGAAGQAIGGHIVFSKMIAKKFLFE
jgi:hypothetical protein